MVLTCKKNTDYFIKGKEYDVDISYLNNIGNEYRIDVGVKSSFVSCVYFYDNSYSIDTGLYVWDYFYTVEEMRKMKINEIINNG